MAIKKYFPFPRAPGPKDFPMSVLDIQDTHWEVRVQSQVASKTLKMVLDTSLLNTQQYKVRIKGKVEKFRERSSAPPIRLCVEAIEKEVFWSPSTTVANLTYFDRYEVGAFYSPSQMGCKKMKVYIVYRMDTLHISFKKIRFHR